MPKYCYKPAMQINFKEITDVSDFLGMTEKELLISVEKTNPEYNVIYVNRNETCLNNLHDIICPMESFHVYIKSVYCGVYTYDTIASSVKYYNEKRM